MDSKNLSDNKWTKSTQYGDVRVIIVHMDISSLPKSGEHIATESRSTGMGQFNQEDIKSAQTPSELAIVLIAVYIAAQMLADIASLKIGVVAGFAVDMGTFIYPITFTLRDVVHKVLGKRNTQILILSAGMINLLMTGYLMWIASVPGDADWGLTAEFSAILSPVWRIVAASIIAEVVSEMLDTEVYTWFITKITRRYQWARVLTSNSVSVPVDNLIFSIGAFGWLLPWNIVWQIFFFNLAIKYLVTIVSLPLIYLVPDRQ